MKYIFCSLLFILSTLLSFSQTTTVTCSEFKTGDFAYLDSSTNIIWRIKRTAKHQTEKNDKEGIVIKKKIKWLSPCEYQLTQTWTNSKQLRKGNFKSLTYTIISTAGDSYRYSCKCSDGRKIAGTVVKMPG
ncbi:hypothetical protein CAP36_16015 [Chitinophagaceae bacterium IBVUCB2]|nr:hypothetical protein CAP36_16015 [Chitinophagaceae bacterium IBVUCB2]